MTISDLRAKIGNDLGFGGWLTPFDGSPAAYANLSPNDQVRLTNAMKAYIRDNPAAFSTVVQTIAQTPDIGPVSQYGASDAIHDFAGEFGNQALQVGESVAHVGEGIKTTLGLASWVIPTAAFTVVGILLYGFYIKRAK